MSPETLSPKQKAERMKQYGKWFLKAEDFNKIREETLRRKKLK